MRTATDVKPNRLWIRSEGLASPSPVPRPPGVCAWYFHNLRPWVPLQGCRPFDDLAMLYIGIAPKRPPKNGARPSKQTLFNRVPDYYRGNAEDATLRLTLGCLLAETLSIQLRRVARGKRPNFAAGEDQHPAWMQDNAMVTWTVDPAPWVLEDQRIAERSPPLNLDMNRAHPFTGHLRALRQRVKEQARALPVAAFGGARRQHTS